MTYTEHDLYEDDKPLSPLHKLLATLTVAAVVSAVVLVLHWGLTT